VLGGADEAAVEAAAAGVGGGAGLGTGGGDFFRFTVF